MFFHARKFRGPSVLLAPTAMPTHGNVETLRIAAQPYGDLMESLGFHYTGYGDWELRSPTEEQVNAARAAIPTARALLVAPMALLAEFGESTEGLRLALDGDPKEVSRKNVIGFGGQYDWPERGAQLRRI